MPEESRCAHLPFRMGASEDGGNHHEKAPVILGGTNGGARPDQRAEEMRDGLADTFDHASERNLRVKPCRIDAGSWVWHGRVRNRERCGNTGSVVAGRCGQRMHDVRSCKFSVQPVPQ